MRKFYLISAIVLFFCYSHSALGVNCIFNSAGNWNSSGNWVGGFVPNSGDVVTITANCDVNTATAVVSDITINTGITLHILNAATSDLATDGNVTVGMNAFLINDGYFEMLAPANFFLLAGATYEHNPRITSASETMFSNGNEIFSPTSNLTIHKWENTGVALFDNSLTTPRINGDVGNLTIINIGITSVPWEQNGLFTSHVKGLFTVTSSVLRMDDGTGASTILTLQDVLVNGTGNIIFQEGPNRNLTISTGNFTDVSTSTDTMVVMNGSAIGGLGLGALTWTVNGNFIMNHNFIACINPDSSFLRNASAVFTVTGKMVIGGGNTMKFDILKQVNGSCSLTVADTLVISGSSTQPSSVRFLDSHSGNLTVNAGTLVISGGPANTFMGGSASPTAWPLPTGTATINVANDFLITGQSLTYFLNNPINVNKIRVVVGRDFISSSSLADFKVANSLGAVTFKTSRDLLMNGGYFDTQLNTLATGIDTVAVTRNFAFNSSTLSNYFKANAGAGATAFLTTGDFTITNSGTSTGQGVYGNYTGNGNVDFNVGGTFTHTNGQFNGIFGNAQTNGGGNFTFTSGPFVMNNGFFKGINNSFADNSGVPAFTIQSLSFSGGNFIGYNACNIVNATHNFTVTNNLSINFAAASDNFMFNGLPLTNSIGNSIGLNLSVGGSLSIGGVNGTFISSKGFGNETINIIADMSFNGGNNSFNFIPNSGFNMPHTVTFTVGGNLNCTNGTTYLSGDLGDMGMNISGDVSISAGILSIKGSYPFSAAVIVNIMGGYTQSGGVFNFYSNPTIPHTFNNTYITVNVNANDDPVGNFIQSGGTINYDLNASSTVVDSLIIKSPNYTIGPAGNITHAGAGTGTVFGWLRFARTGITIFQRNGNGHDIQQIKQLVGPATTLDVITGDIQCASNNVAALDFFEMLAGCTVTLRNNSQIKSNVTNTYSGIFLGNGARLRIQNTNGLYNTSGTAAINNSGSMNYYLHPNSIVEYFGNDTQWLTGYGTGLATLNQHKYGILEINFVGTPNIEWVHPATVGIVAIRTQLILSHGELSLSDHNPLAGVSITIESGATTAILRNASTAPWPFIRAETTDGLSLVKWVIGSTKGMHEIPFGYDATSYYYIPFRYTPNGAVAISTGTLQVSTYHTPPTNLPYPPGVGHVNNLAGANNSANVADRFWYVNRSGATDTLVSLTFTAYNAGVVEFPLAVANFKPQHYNTVNGGWDNPFQGAGWANAVVAPSANSISVNSIKTVNGWWSLVNSATPLPVSLLNFSARCDKNNNVNVNWSTATESNCDYYEVEKSNNGKEYSLLKQVKGMGTTNEKTSYEVIDNSPYNNISYYRLKQFDFNGDYTDYDPVSVYSCNKDKFKVIYTTSTDNKLKIVAVSPNEGNFSLELFDLAGQPVHHSNIELREGVNDIYINELNITRGIYMLRINGASDNFTAKIPVFDTK